MRRSTRSSSCRCFVLSDFATFFDQLNRIARKSARAPRRSSLLVDMELRLSYDMHGHRIRISTVDLGKTGEIYAVRYSL